MKKSVILFLLFLFIPSLTLSDPLTDIQPGEWYEAPNSKLGTLAPNPLPDGSWNGFKAVMESWSGAGYDSKRDKLIVWGGGHHDYSGNEIYAFDVNNLIWEKLANSSTDFTGDEKSGEYPDGLPRSRHTYDYIQYVPRIDAFCTFGGQAMFPSGQTGTDKTHCFDFATQKWVRKNSGAQGSIGGLSAIDETSGKAWTQSAGGSARLREWDPVSDIWVPHVSYDKGWLEYYYTAAIGAGKFIAVGINAAGKGQMMVWNLSTPDAQPLISEIPLKISITNSPGFVFDTKRNLFVAWAGGSKIFSLNPVNMNWDEIPIATSNTITPTTAEKYGTYGRFRYIVSKDLFIAVNRTSENVYFFRMPLSIPIKIQKGPFRLDQKHSTFFYNSAGRHQIKKKRFEPVYSHPPILFE